MRRISKPSSLIAALLTVFLFLFIINFDKALKLVASLMILWGIVIVLIRISPKNRTMMPSRYK